MNELKFRTLYAEEIECKATVMGSQIEIALHCRAETCTQLLNEIVGPMDWEKEYTNNNRNCIVRIWDKEKQRMISKEDCGGGQTEVEGLKGQASNGFKRVCALGWGLGIELYSQPEIRIPLTDDNSTMDKHGQPVVSERYRVSEITYSDKRKITSVTVVDSKGNVVWPFTEAPLMDSIDEYQDTPAPAEDLTVDEDDIVEDLPDNTDQYEAPEEYETQVAPYSEDYAAVIRKELVRTHIREADILKALQIDSLDKIDDADEDVVQGVIAKLKSRPTFQK
jgi:hypothetical protein